MHLTGSKEKVCEEHAMFYTHNATKDNSFVLYPICYFHIYIIWSAELQIIYPELKCSEAFLKLKARNSWQLQLDGQIVSCTLLCPIFCCSFIRRWVVSSATTGVATCAKMTGLRCKKKRMERGPYSYSQGAHRVLAVPKISASFTK